MGALWKFFSGEDDTPPPAPSALPTMERSTVWGFLTGQHAEPDRSPAAMQEAIAWHEAAHARVARSKGKWQVGGMWADGESESGLTQVAVDSSTGSLHAYLLTCAAGQAGAMRYYRNKGYSLRTARELAAEGTGSDRAQFDAAAGGSARWDDYVDEAYRIVRRQEYTIEQNAKPLARKGRRSGTWA